MLFITYKGAIEFCEKDSAEPLKADDVFNIDECGVERDPGAISTSVSTSFEPHRHLFSCSKSEKRQRHRE